jgi:hypothetical protein
MSYLFSIFSDHNNKIPPNVIILNLFLSKNSEKCFL